MPATLDLNIAHDVLLAVMRYAAPILSLLILLRCGITLLFFRKELVKSHPANEHYVFQMGEIYGLQNTPEQRRLYDYYYHYHCSCVLVLQVVLRCLGKRGFATYGDRKRS